MGKNMSRLSQRAGKYRGRSVLAMFFHVPLLTLFGLTPAHSQTSQFLGRITEATIPSNGLSANFKRAARFTLGTRGTTLVLCAYVDGNGGVSGEQRMRLALYTDNNGSPGTKVFETQEGLVRSGERAHWFCSIESPGTAGPPLRPIAPGSYWIAIHTAGTAGVIRDFADGPANWFGNADAFDDGASNTFGAGNRGTGTMSVFARYFPDSQLRHAGRTTIGSTPSKGMTPDFKRGSGFTLPERGTLFAVSAYLDGRGTTDNSAQGTFRYSIYKDANGLPDTRVYEGFTQYLRGTSPPVRYSVRAPRVCPPCEVTLDPGRYWVVMHTGIFSGGPPGIIRNYGDGTAGNWYGNADAFFDGASEQFGPGTPGNGTIAAYVSYRPASVTSGRFGRTEPGTLPSKGLKANFSRASQFILEDDVAPTLTGLHAYLDGLGGASGSQKVRMAIYEDVIGRCHLDECEPSGFFKIAESQEVTITAGMPARWVHFAVPSVVLASVTSQFRILIQSGDTAGVVRDFVDRRTFVLCGNCDQDRNWYGLPDAFADGAADGADTQNIGEGTLSVYATYSLPPL
jgi:hypothetical protein